MTLLSAGLGRTVASIGLLSSVLLGSACGGSDTPLAAVTTVAAARGLDLATSPQLSGEPVLTISGKGIDERFSDGLQLDVAALDRLRVVDAVVDDPWEKRTITYRGVLMSDLIEALDTDGATELRITALDDYEVTLPLGDLVSGQALLATSIDGARLDIENGGPTKIVFLPESVAGENKDLWIWSIKEMVAQ